ncbi:MAG TPA: uroporphyrinogen decarboxylase family protein [Sedimentisphaerales bacterium]|nr:uroporphyrinogen decarboxylase family protein [Sedimentisphaerales bacterium]
MKMTARQRLMAALRGEPVDRPAVNLYEIGGLAADPDDPDPFNVYNDPSWRPLLDLAEQRTDLIRMRSPVRKDSHRAWGENRNDAGIRGDFFKTETFEENARRTTRTTLTIAGRTMNSTTRRQRDLDTIWTTEHLVKSNDDLHAYLQLPDEVFAETIDITPLLEEENKLGERGIVMVDTEDPICAAAVLFSMEDFTVLALTEQKLFHQLLEKHARYIQARTEQVSRQLPGRLWRIYGPEFATEPYLPPHLFDEYVLRYTAPMVQAIKQTGGFARIHVHGKIRNVLRSIIRMGADAIDPIEPPPQGDVELAYVRSEYGKDLVLFGNIEIADIENAEATDFEKMVRRALNDGTRGQGRGFVLMPSASPIGRKVAARTMKNYETIVRVVEGL